MPNQNFIGGSVGRRPAAGRTDDVLNPATGEVIAKVAGVRRRRRRRRGRGGRGGVRRVVGDDAPRPQRAPAPVARRDRGRPATRSSGSRCETAASPRSIIEFEMDLTVDNWRFFAGGARFLEGRAAGEYLEDHTSYVRRDPLGVVGSHRAVELPDQHGDVEARSRARGRQHRRAQAVGAHAADRAAARRDHRRHPPDRRAQRRDRPGRDRGRRARAPPEGRDGVAHRQRRDRQGRSPGPPPRRSSACTSSSAARRRSIVFDDADIEAAVAMPHRHVVLQLGPGLHRAVPAHGRARASSTIWSRVSPTRVGKIDDRRPVRRGHRDGPGRSPADQLDRVAGMVDRAVDAGAEVTVGGARARPARLLLRAVGRGEPRAGQRDRAARGVRTRRRRPAVQRRGAGARVGERRRLRPLGQRVDDRRRAGDAHDARRCTSAACG